MRKSFCNRGLGIGLLDGINTGMNVLNTGINVYKATQDYNQAPSPSLGDNITIVNERQLTDEEIKILQDKHQQWRQNQELDRALKMQDSANIRRYLDNEFRPPEQDNTALYIVAGLLFFGLFVSIIKK